VFHKVLVFTSNHLQPFPGAYCNNIRKIAGGKKVWYHRAYYKNDSGKEVYKPFRCHKDDPKKCHGNYKLKNGLYCQPYREAEKELNFRKGEKTIEIGNLTDLPDADKVQLLEALAIAKKNNVSLTTLVRSAETAQGPVKHIGLVEARKVYLAAQLDNGHEAQHRKASGITAELVNHFHDIGLHELDIEGVQNWARGVKRWSNGHKNRALLSLLSFWNHFKSLKYSLPEDSPFAFADKAAGKPGVTAFTVVDEPKDTLTVRESEKVLREALTHPVTAAVVVLVLVCGVRTEEASRLCWHDIELDQEPEVYISPRNAKKFKPTKLGKVLTASRHIQLTDHQVAWLRAAKEAGGLLPVNLGMYNKKLSGRKDERKQARIKKIEEALKNPRLLTPDVFCTRDRRVGHKKLNAKEEKARLTARLESLKDYMAGVSPWLRGRQNVLRHTYCSMHVAHFESIGLTAHYAGNSERTIRLNYLEVIKPTEAKKFWELMP